jgi:hypothetical protein
MLQETMKFKLKAALRRSAHALLLSCFLLIGTLAFAQELTGQLPTDAADTKSRRVTNFEWDAIEGAKSYEVEISPIGKTSGNKDPFRFTVTEPVWNGELKPGKYTMRLRSRDKRGVPGEWSGAEEFYVKLYAPKPVFPLALQEIKSEEDESYEVTFKWEYQSEASNYKIHIEDDAHTFSQNYETSDSELKVKLPVARKYTWSIIGYDKQDKEGESLDGSIPFIILGKKIETPKITMPETSYVRELQWESVKNGELYSYTLLRRGNDRKWRKVKNEDLNSTTLPFDAKWKGGEYKFSVSAKGTLRENSKTHSIIFKVANGDRSVAAEQKAQMRKAIERTTDWYFIASYLITQIKYSATNYDRNADSGFNAIGGTGRLGAGYLDDASPFGFLGIVDLSGFIIGNKNYTYPGLEAHGIFRWSSGDLGEIRISGGGYYKEIPEILANNVETGDFDVSQLGAFGIHGGGEYWYSLNSKLGLQVNGRLYYPISGKTPTGQGIVATPSYQFGFLGSLRLNAKATGLMGYAYRKDQIDYKTSNPTVLAAGYKSNKTSVEGHYLNFFLEWDF